MIGGYLKVIHAEGNVCKISNSESSVYINIFIDAFKNHINLPYKCPLEPVNILINGHCARTLTMKSVIEGKNSINFELKLFVLISGSISHI